MSGVVFKSYGLVKELIESTRTESGLRVTANIITKIYEKGKKACSSIYDTGTIIFDAETALDSITTFRQQAPSEQLSTAFSSLEQRGSLRRDNLQSKLELVNFELRELLSPNTMGMRENGEAFQQLFTG